MWRTTAFQPTKHNRHGKIEKTSNTLEQRIRVVLLVTAPQYQHARNQSAAVPSSAASGSRNFPGRTSTIATVSGVRRKTGLDVQIRVTTVQHHEDCQVLRLRLKRYATTSVPTRLHRRQRGQRLLTAAAHSRHTFEVAPFSSPPFFAKGRPEGLWISMTHHQHGSQRRVSWSTTMCQKR